MKSSLLKKLDVLVARHAEVADLLSSTAVIQDQDQFRVLSQEHAKLAPVVACYQDWRHLQSEQAGVAALLQDGDADMRALAGDEQVRLEADLVRTTDQLQRLLLPEDPNDQCNVFVEVRAGTGGLEAALFAGVLVRMYSRYAETCGWQVHVISAHEGDQGGFKQAVLQIQGQQVYGRLKFESGVHRVQRVPETESQGRIHTSACTVAVLPEVDEVESIAIDMNEVRVDTFRASGAGGQHVNKTDSAIRLTHLPSGLVVECQEERSQHKNRAKALRLLQSRLVAKAQAQQRQDQADVRKSLVGSGDRSERIRTYNFPQSRVTDHRIGLTLYHLDEITMGALDQVIEPLLQEHQAELLARLDD